MKKLIVLLGLVAACQAEYKEKYTIDHTYYTMSLYQQNFDGMYEKHLVDMSDAHNHEFLSQQSQARIM